MRDAPEAAVLTILIVSAILSELGVTSDAPTKDKLTNILAQSLKTLEQNIDKLEASKTEKTRGRSTKEIDKEIQEAKQQLKAFENVASSLGYTLEMLK